MPRVVNFETGADDVERAIKFHGATVAPKMTIPGIGYIAYCTDTEGNLFGVIQENREAK